MPQLDSEIKEDEAYEELKRADHLIFVTLKYTRTVDVIKNIIHRLINAMDYAIIDSLEYFKKKKKIKELPLTPISRADALKKLTSRNVYMSDFLNFYYMLKKIDKAEFTRKEEFRKNVRMIVMQNDEAYEVNMEKVHQFYTKTNEFIDFVEEKYKK
ncbi:hypothetical protein K8R47_01525 [archaeon]|nr:hypothetical protein [archaeon]